MAHATITKSTPATYQLVAHFTRYNGQPTTAVMATATYNQLAHLAGMVMDAIRLPGGDYFKFCTDEDTIGIEVYHNPESGKTSIEIEGYTLDGSGTALLMMTLV